MEPRFLITLEGSGGELDRREAATSEDARKMAIEMIKSAGELLDGDVIRVVQF